MILRGLECAMVHECVHTLAFHNPCLDLTVVYVLELECMLETYIISASMARTSIFQPGHPGARAIA
eukprot:1168130-Amphidinium_carterae.1